MIRITPILNFRHRHRYLNANNNPNHNNEKKTTIVLGLLLATMFSSSFIKKHINYNSKTDIDNGIDKNIN